VKRSNVPDGGFSQEFTARVGAKFKKKKKKKKTGKAPFFYLRKIRKGVEPALGRKNKGPAAVLGGWPNELSKGESLGKDFSLWKKKRKGAS